jgi:dolichyl-phosphate beta-glucosyltransferase
VRRFDENSNRNPNGPSQSVVIPTFNEAERIDRTIETVLHYLSCQPYTSELIVVNDGSSDDTLDRANRWRERSSLISVVDTAHAGKAAAVRRGVETASHELVLFSDADLATPIENLGHFREEIAAGYDIVIGSREGAGASRIGEPAMRHIMGRAFNGLVRVLLLPGIQDTQCGFKLFTQASACDLFSTALLYQAADGLDTGARVTAFDVELLVIARRHGYSIKIVPVTWTFGENSKVSPVHDTINNLSDVLKVKWHDLQGRYD